MDETAIIWNDMIPLEDNSIGPAEHIHKDGNALFTGEGLNHAFQSLKRTRNHAHLIAFIKQRAMLACLRISRVLYNLDYSFGSRSKTISEHHESYDSSSGTDWCNVLPG